MKNFFWLQVRSIGPGVTSKACAISNVSNLLPSLLTVCLHTRSPPPSPCVSVLAFSSRRRTQLRTHSHMCLEGRREFFCCLSKPSNIDFTNDQLISFPARANFRGAPSRSSWLAVRFAPDLSAKGSNGLGLSCDFAESCAFRTSSNGS